MTPAGAFHGHIEGLLLARIRSHVEANGLGKVFSGDTGFVLERSPDTVRSPDVAFVRAERVPSEPVEGFFPAPPDLAIEIRSPEDKNAEILGKIAQYLATGVQVVWDVNPKTKTVTVYRQDSEEILRTSDTLTEESLLPGLAIDVGEPLRLGSFRLHACHMAQTLLLRVGLVNQALPVVPSPCGGRRSRGSAVRNRRAESAGRAGRPSRERTGLHCGSLAVCCRFPRSRGPVMVKR